MIPTEIERIYNPLNNEILTLHGEWKIFRQLYVTKDIKKIDPKIELLRKTAKVFFRYVKELLGRDIILRIACLTDKAQMGKDKNLSLNRLIEIIDAKRYAKLHTEISTLVNELDNETKAIRKIRHKTIAHFDEAGILEGGLPFNQITTTVIDNIIKKLGEIVFQFEDEFSDNPNENYKFQHIDILDADVSRLLKCLEDSINFQGEIREAKFKKKKLGISNNN